MNPRIKTKNQQKKKNQQKQKQTNRGDGVAIYPPDNKIKREARRELNWSNRWLPPAHPGGIKVALKLHFTTSTTNNNKQQQQQQHHQQQQIRMETFRRINQLEIDINLNLATGADCFNLNLILCHEWTPTPTPPTPPTTKRVTMRTAPPQHLIDSIAQSNQIKSIQTPAGNFNQFHQSMLVGAPSSSSLLLLPTRPPWHRFPDPSKPPLWQIRRNARQFVALIGFLSIYLC